MTTTMVFGTFYESESVREVGCHRTDHYRMESLQRWGDTTRLTNAPYLGTCEQLRAARSIESAVRHETEPTKGDRLYRDHFYRWEHKWLGVT